MILTYVRTVLGAFPWEEEPSTGTEQPRPLNLAALRGMAETGEAAPLAKEQPLTSTPEPGMEEGDEVSASVQL